MKNKNLYSTPAEQTKAFLSFCAEHKCETCDFRKVTHSEHVHDKIECCLHWLEAESDTPQCPFCGGELIEFSIDDKSKYAFHCPSPTCRFMSPIFTRGKRKELVDVLKSMVKARKESAVK